MTLLASMLALTVIVAVTTITGQQVPAREGTDTSPGPGHCEMSFQAFDQSWKGLCGPVLGNKESTTLTARNVESLPGGVGRGDARPTLMVLIDTTDPWGKATHELELYGKDGVIRSQAWGWRPITVLAQSATTLRFRVAETQAEPTDLDRRIVERAAKILAAEADWDRADDRKCAPEDKTWSMYCAIHRASIEVSGGFHHRRPCLQIVRTILNERVAEERKKGRKYPHVMMDYNNDKTTHLADVHSLFIEAIARMKR